MSKLLMIFTLEFIMRSHSATYCNFADENDGELQEILKVRNRVFKGKTFDMIISEADNLKTVTSEFKRFCVQMTKYRKIDEQAHNEALLGAGGFGIVLSVDFKGENNAVKMLSFEQYIRPRLLSHMGKIANKWSKVDQLIDCFKTLKLLEPQTEGNKVSFAQLLQTDYDFKNFCQLDQIKKDVPDLQNFIKTMLTNYLNLL